MLVAFSSSTNRVFHQSSRARWRPYYWWLC